MNFRIIAAAIATLFAVSGAAYAAPAASVKSGLAKGLSAPAYRSALHWTQSFLLDGTMTSVAKVGGVSTTAAGFGLNTNVTELPGAQVVDLPKVVGVSGALSKAQVQEAIKYWHTFSRDKFLADMAAWMRTKGVSHGYFNFTQEVNVTTTNGVRKQNIAWSGFVDSTGKGTYGAPRLIDPDPTMLEVMYWSKRSDDSLPADWSFADGGKLKYRVLDRTFKPLSVWTEVDLYGAYDETDEEQSTQSLAIQCLVDSTELTGCPAAPTVRKLIEETGASGALLKYARRLQPVYEKPAGEPEDSEVVTPVRAYSYEDRVWLCDSLENSGEFGYLLESTVDTYWVAEGAPRYSGTVLTSERTEALSQTESFKVTATAEQLAGRHPGTVLISPFGDGAVWNIPSPEAESAVDIAPIRINPVTGASSAMTPPTSDVYVSVTASGDARHYTIGSVGDNYFGQGLHERTFSFNIDDVSQVEEFTLLDAYFDDHLFIEVNDKLAYAGTESWGWNWYFPIFESFASNDGVWTLPGAFSTRPTGLAFTTTTIYPYASWESSGPAVTVPAFGIKIAPEPTSCKKSRRRSGYRNQGQTVSDMWGNTYNLGLGLCPKEPEVLIAGDSLYPLERGRTWGATLNRDLRSMLVNGQNKITVNLAVGGKGEFWFNIRERSNNCNGLGISESAPPNTIELKPKSRSSIWNRLANRTTNTLLGW